MSPNTYQYILPAVSKTTTRLLTLLVILLTLFMFMRPVQTGAAPGDVDLSFDPGSSEAADVHTVAVQPDGKVLIGGIFTTVSGVTRNRIARLNADGSLDSSFDPGSGASNAVEEIVLQPDGKVLVVGRFTYVDGTLRRGIARLTPDGSLDPKFDPRSGANDSIDTVALQADGKIIIGGQFTQFAGVDHARIARLNSDGSLDTTFDPGSGATGSAEAPEVNELVVQADGRLLIGGSFDSINGITRRSIARLNADGSLDTSFDAGNTIPNDGGFFAGVEAIALQADGNLVVGGISSFNSLAFASYIVRLDVNGGLDSSFDAGGEVNGKILSIDLQSNGQLIVGGDFIAIDGTERDSLARLNADGSLDAGFTPALEPDSAFHDVLVTSGDNIFVGGDFDDDTGFGTIVRPYVARLNASGSVDTALSSDLAKERSGIDGAIERVVLQSDGKVLIKGSFIRVDNVSEDLVRLNSDGRLDTSFNFTLATEDRVGAIALQPDQKILVSVSKITFGDPIPGYIRRLNADGSTDPSFNSPDFDPNGSVGTIAVQADGKIIIEGTFIEVNGVARGGLARLNSNGSLDTSFSPGSVTGPEPWSDIEDIVVQEDGKILIAGDFTDVGGVSRNGIARLNANGSLDTSFNPGSGLDNSVQTLALQTDGKVLIGGSFTSANGVTRNGLARLNANGSVDTSFDSGSGAQNVGFIGYIYALALQPDGKVIVGGRFVEFNGQERNNVVRLHSDGRVDTSFDPRRGPNGNVNTIALQTDGSIFIGGDFSEVDGVAHSKIARFEGRAPAYTSSPAPGSTVDVGSTTIGTAVNTTIRVSEVGDVMLEVTSASISGAHADDFAVDPATFNIPVGGNPQDIMINCTPSALGQRTALLTVEHNGNDSPATYSLICTGTQQPETPTPVPPVDPNCDPVTTINFSTGAPGSSFNVVGTCFAPNTPIAVEVNGEPLTNQAVHTNQAVLANSIMTDADGTVAVRLNTDATAGVGVYRVELRVVGGVMAQTSVGSTVRYSLTTDTPLRQPAAFPPGTPVPVEIAVPARIAAEPFSVYLPLLQR